MQQLAASAPGTNHFISPYSVSATLQMVANGARGRTLTEMQHVLGLTNLSAVILNHANDELEKSLNHTVSGGAVLSTANSIWCRKGTPFVPEFIQCNQQFYHARVEALDFKDPNTAGVINAWVSEKTKGKIAGIVQNPLDPDMQMLLANAVYFKGTWERPFDVNLTKPSTFHVPVGDAHTVPMMDQSGEFVHRKGSGYEAVRLGYMGGSTAMYIFLPDKGSSPAKLLNIMNGTRWRQVTKPGFSLAEGHLEMPKLKLERGTDFNKILKMMGMKMAFESAGEADFSGISSQRLFISEVRQQAIVEIDEKGTEAAAVTGMVATASIVMERPKPFEMIVDRPFLFLIEDSPTGTILFMGVVNDPVAG